ncbi:hypothetical protein K525DRAFT_241359 [Schizophyllum commune Loenen D]|nr:hypothetical protein K525DRAFT_241359 [Schizophyllum commune Loenen D]
MASAPSRIWAGGARGFSIARRPCPQGKPAHCMGLGSCTVPIFSRPAPATLAGRALLRGVGVADPNPVGRRTMGVATLGCKSP